MPIDVNADVLASIQAWWITRPDLQALVSLGRISHKTAAENASVMPYMTFFLVSNVLGTPTTSYGYWEAVVQFNVHHYLPGLALTLAKKIADAMSSVKPGGGAQLWIEGTPAIHVLPESFSVDEGEGLGLNGRDCWVCMFTVSIPFTN
jgi:hypothetical protein